jgi:hypothetical protein
MGGRHANLMVGLMNTSAQMGGLLSSIACGYIVARFHSDDAPFVPMATLLFIGTVLWFRVDASKEVYVAGADARRSRTGIASRRRPHETGNRPDARILSPLRSRAGRTG